MLLPRSSSAMFALLACLVSAGVSLGDRRVVDVVEVGNAISEAKHGYESHDVLAGVASGKSFRQARGWMHYGLATFDDTEVTIACTFVRTDSGGVIEPRRFDIVVEDSVLATRTVTIPSITPVVVEITVPFAITKGKTHISVIIRANGGPTPALRELRTIQDHYELDPLLNPFGVAR